MKPFIKETGTTEICLLLAVYIALALNLGFFTQLWGIYTQTDSIHNDMLVTVPFVLIAVLNILLLPFSGKYILKPAFIFVVISTALFNYGTFTFGTIFDNDMFLNIVQTDVGEAHSYITPHFILAFLATAILPSLLIAVTPLRTVTFKTACKRNAVSLVLSFAVIFSVAGVYYQDYVSVGRNNKMLRKSLNPSYPYKQAYNYIYETYFYVEPEYEQIALDAKIAEKPQRRKKLVLFVLGETQRSENYSLNGYARETNPYLKEYPVTTFKKVLSYGTATAISVPYIFSLATDKYTNGRAETSRDNIIDVVQRAGVHTEWLDNDGGCKGACKGAIFTDLRKKYLPDESLCLHKESCFDSVFIQELKEKLPALAKEDTFLVLHAMGSHGPSYWQRYPSEFKRFEPDCPKNDIQNCTREELINTYDNSILYDDFIMTEVIKIAQEQAPDFDVTLLFLSDHGESLGEDGIYLHGLPKGIAPRTQRAVPFIAWFSDGFLATEKMTRDCLQREAGTRDIDNANIAHSLLGLLSIKTAIYQREKDYFATCRTSK